MMEVSSEVDLRQVTISNTNGMQVVVTNYGATVMSIKLPDRNGILQEMTLGFDNLQEYVQKRNYMGCIAGRVANRIAQGRFTLDEVNYQLNCNNGANHLHGGPKGWAKLMWNVEEVIDGSVSLSHHSPDGDEGYPGNVVVTVHYLVEETNTLSIRIEATTDAPTLINPTSHCYFNLTPGHNETILDHVLQINADAFTPSNAELIPTGEIVSVNNTPMDFRLLKRVGSEIDAQFDQLVNANGYDHNWVLSDYDGTLRKCATLSSLSSGITMDTWTNQPGLQCYSGNSLGSVVGRKRQHYTAYSGICLETQGFPDAINHPDFPSVILRPGERYLHETRYVFLQI
jgi:aldose 1-epimerase